MVQQRYCQLYPPLDRFIRRQVQILLQMWHSVPDIPTWIVAPPPGHVLVSTWTRHLMYASDVDHAESNLTHRGPDGLRKLCVSS
jgi:hypothetical protein